MKLRNEYPWLYIITILLKITAILILAYTVFLVALSNNTSLPNDTGAMLVIAQFGLGGFIGASIFFAFAELIKVIARIELNTRTNNQLTPSMQTPVQSIQPIQVTTTASNQNEAYLEWKKYNPDKSLNDFYASKNKK